VWPNIARRAMTQPPVAIHTGADPLEAAAASSKEPEH
jgi:hypothetical protein